jgi:predicted nucleic acid-binding protein
MKPIFADTVYYLALTNPNDQYAQAAREFTKGFAGSFITTSCVLTEVANSLSRGTDRALFRELYEELSHDRRVTIVPTTRDLLESGVELFARRHDKEWSLTDCISFIVMQQNGLIEALTADKHFEQAGFLILLDND